MNDETKAPDEPEVGDESDALSESEILLSGWLVDKLMEEIKGLQQPWQQMPEPKQQHLLDRIQNSVDNTTRRAVRVINAAGCIHLSGTIKKLTKGEKLEVGLIMHGGGSHEAQHELFDRTGGDVVILMTEPENFIGPAATQADPAQTDLVEATEEVVTGDASGVPPQPAMPPVGVDPDPIVDVDEPLPADHPDVPVPQPPPEPTQPPQASSEGDIPEEVIARIHAATSNVSGVKSAATPGGQGFDENLGE